MTKGGEAYERLAELIARYLERQPQASDSFEGICDWWIPEQKLREARHDVQRALDYLVASHRIVAETMVDGRAIYRARREGRPAAMPDAPLQGRGTC